ncbi:DNA-binding response OmpR family regulator [Clostridium tetanomorphum]|uniref:Stage 0 sporulation protein A homolog n=1 Tax=Clostridium tetanomorphum TaxID=1553 RepID=A0A923E9J7_CLOTT|nr:response regulator transcription factor [Clostridium tetanomorphum]KAJ52545.1 transcriptional regulatory component of sensory transduction system [Clostridium tetanomorphum DSM 665]MBC2396303.1 response regulator transcription factor [Clostridium tetanomorphum]MBP1863465.1 DNA-binding response OmpR family regulator [Clostridium tetanomorphum]NRS83562.1 DNA-binding response OmpR family regulator [Clostridium tetanomorphum]NRZ96764.1 DNA-binding response OmpR family regulator [Clostridium tet
MNNILLVEDDSILSYSVEYTLNGEGFNVECADSIKKAREIFKENNFHLIILDVMLPDGNGYDFCKEIRKESEIPIIFLTACDEEANVVIGLDIGGDDYITKPFRIKELISRIRAILRRSKTISKDVDVLISGDIKVETLQGKVEKNAKEIILTALEYRLLLIFINHPKQILSRNVILEGLWDAEGEFVDDNTLSVYIRRLREKIEDNVREPKYITTHRGLGYRWGYEVSK